MSENKVSAAVAAGVDSAEEDMDVDSDKEVSKKANHPTYVSMLVEAIREQQTSWNTGISRAKIVEYIKSKYNLDDVNSTILKRAVQTAEEKEMIEHKTGTGISGSFLLTKKERALQAKKSTAEKPSNPAEKPSKTAEKPSKTAEKPSKTAEKSTKASEKSSDKSSEAKSKPKPAKKAEVDAQEAKKDVKKKPPVAKGKENKEKPKKDAPVQKPTLKKSASRSTVSDNADEPVTSTSKQTGRKNPAPKKAKVAK